MPKKVQIKLLSTSGELLNVVTCYSGQVTVFRANTASDLRPYQRALSGISGKERISVSVDGAEYDVEQHNLVGLGEVPPHSGLSVRAFFAQCGVSEDNTSALLSSFGISAGLDAACSSLSQDEERRIRLLAGTCEPGRVLVLNEPFESITSQWREPFAQLLTNFARQRGGLVIVTSLSYRPESWIDNDSIARTQVGETIQRTIGFGSAQSKGNDLMNQLRDAVRTDEAAERHRQEQSGMGFSAAATGGALLTSHGAHDSSLIDTPYTSGDQVSVVSKLGSFINSLGNIHGRELKYGVGLLSVGLVCAAVSVRILSSNPSTPDISDPVLQEEGAPPSAPEQKERIAEGNSSSPTVDGTTGNQEAKVADNQQIIPTQPSVLDGYADTVRTSILETTRGTVLVTTSHSPLPSENQGSPGPQKREDSGNLFKLLESASGKPDDRSGGVAPSDEAEPTDSAGWTPPQNEEPEEVDASEEQQRREAIRQKFLEAIRAAAAKRQASMDDTGT